MTEPLDSPLVAEAARIRTTDVVGAVAELSPAALEGPSGLPGWSRLTITCHLRYGAAASRRMTAEALGNLPTSFYPGGRSVQRPATLAPAPGEDAAAVVASLGEESLRLHERWASLSSDQWATAVTEPTGETDLGSISLGTLALLRLTEVEVHGLDLDVGLSDWSDVFVRHALPFRLAWLARRRSNHRAVDPDIEGSWLLVASDGPSWRVAVRDGVVHSAPAQSGAEADAVMEGTSRDLLALLLGRRPLRPLRTAGAHHLAATFGAAFPGP